MTKIKEMVQVSVKYLDSGLYESLATIDSNWYGFSKNAYLRHEMGYEGYENAKNYVSSVLENLIEYRMFMYHKEMGKIISAFQLEENDILGIGWSKFKELKKIAQMIGMTREEFLRHIGNIKGLTFEEVKEYIKSVLGVSAPGKEVKFVVKMNQEQLDLVEEWIRTYKEINRIEDQPDVNALIIMAGDFLSSLRIDGTKVETPLSRKISEEI